MKATLNRIAAVTAIEIRLSVRNRWVALSTLILVLFALALAFLGSGPAGASKVGALTLTAASLATLSVYLIPLIALLLSYETIAGEVERSTLPLVLATPVRRFEVLTGKFVGHLSVLTLAIVVGYSIAALAVVAVHGADLHGALAWARLIATGVLLGAVFVAIGILVSASTARVGTAAALLVGIWLVLIVLYDLALLAGLIVDDGGFFTKSLFPALVIANPGDAFRLYNLAALEGSAPVAGIDGLARSLPFPPSLALAALAAWLAAMIAAGLWRFQKVRP
ncbi:ABC transporter permease [Consotaella salsifontis]|uniref:Cu-processing system permease protein n=1 Tax=Consotaella salsifontis TaxID=1365950 RepID=A0A1T4SVS3_9HYPH|nr:ABC transporter permease subunit [Consotaella salsifontis]SKA32028.1 Cu-processing system permease protein [Consotaella salsifontis]